MVPLPTWLSIPTAGATAAINTTGLDMSVLYVPNDLVPAQHLNYFLNGFSNNGNVSETAVSNIVSELLTILTAASISPNGGLTNQVKAALDALYATVGGLSAEATARSNADSLLAPKASPALTGTPTAPTPAASDNSTNVSTTQYADRAVSNFGNSFTGTGSFSLFSGGGSFTPAVSGAIRSNYMILIRQGTGSGGGGKMALLLYSTLGGTVTLTTVSNQTSITFGVSGTAINITGGQGSETMDWRAYAII